MIIRTEDGRLRLINQADHSEAAGQFASVWGCEPFRAPSPPEPVRLAAAIHDAGWQPWDAQPTLHPETNRPYDFIHIPSDQRVAIYERSVKAALDAHPYAGLLVSMHGAGFYKKRYGYMPKLEFRDVAPQFRATVDQFVARQRALQDELITALRPDVDALWTHYRWLQSWDALAVYLGMDDPADRRTFSLGVMPHCPGGPEVELFLTGLGEGTYTVSPWPFVCRQIDVAFPMRWVADRPYASREEFLGEFAAAPVEVLHLVVKAI